MKKLKKLLALMLSFLMVISVVDFSAFADVFAAAEDSVITYSTNHSSAEEWRTYYDSNTLYVETGNNVPSHLTGDNLSAFGTDAWSGNTGIVAGSKNKNAVYAPVFVHPSELTNITSYYQYQNVAIEPQSAEFYYTRNNGTKANYNDDAVKRSFMEVIYGISPATEEVIYGDDDTTQIGTAYTTTLYLAGFNIVDDSGTYKLLTRFFTRTVVDKVYTDEVTENTSSSEVTENTSITNKAFGDLEITGSNPNGETGTVAVKPLLKVTLTYDKSDDAKTLIPQFAIQAKYDVTDAEGAVETKEFSLTLTNATTVDENTKKAVGFYVADINYQWNPAGAFANPTVTYLVPCEHVYDNVCDADCNECGEVRTVTHVLEHIEAKAATVTGTGNKEYWRCTDACKKLYLDAEGTQETTLEEVTIPAWGNQRTYPTNFSSAEEWRAYYDSNTLYVETGNNVPSHLTGESSLSTFGADAWSENTGIVAGSSSKNAVYAPVFVHPSELTNITSYYQYQNVAIEPQSAEFYYTRNNGTNATLSNYAVTRSFMEVIYGISPATEEAIYGDDETQIGTTYTTTLYLAGFNIVNDSGTYKLLTRFFTRTVVDKVYTDGDIENTSSSEVSYITSSNIKAIGDLSITGSNPNDETGTVAVKPLLKVALTYDTSADAKTLVPKFEIQAKYDVKDEEGNVTTTKDFSLTLTNATTVDENTKKAVGFYVADKDYGYTPVGAFANPTVTYLVPCEHVYDNVCDADCNECGEVRTVTHVLEHIEAKAATVTGTGNKEYWRCTDACKKLYLDAEGTQETTLEEVTIPAWGYQRTYPTNFSSAEEWRTYYDSNTLYVETEKNVPSHLTGESNLSTFGADAWSANTGIVAGSKNKNAVYAPVFVHPSELTNITSYYQYQNVALEPQSAEFYYTRNNGTKAVYTDWSVSKSFMEVIYGISPATEEVIYGDDDTTQIGTAYTTTLYLAGFNIVNDSGTYKLLTRFFEREVVDKVYTDGDIENTSESTISEVTTANIVKAFGDLSITGSNPNDETGTVAVKPLLKVALTYDTSADAKTLVPKFEIQAKYDVKDEEGNVTTTKDFSLTLTNATTVDENTKKAVGFYVADASYGYDPVGAFANPTVTYGKTQFEKTYAQLLALDVSRVAPYDETEVTTLLDAYENLNSNEKNALSNTTIAAISNLQVAVEAWTTTNDTTIAESYVTIHGKPSDESSEWDVEAAWNVYNRLTAEQKKLLDTSEYGNTYDTLVQAMQAEEQVSGNTTIGWVGDSIPDGLTEKLGDSYNVSAFAEDTNYDIVVVAKTTSEAEIHSYLRMANTPFVIMATNAESQEGAEANMSVATAYGMPCIDIYAYTKGGGTNTVETYANAILSLQKLFATEAVTGFSFDESRINSFLTPQLFSATIKNTAVPAEQGLGFKTNINEYQKTGTSIVAYGTIFARYSSTQSFDDMVLENVNNGKYFKARIAVTDDADLYGNSYIAGINLHNNSEFSKVYIARSFIEYADGTVYYSINTRTDLASSLATRTGVVDGYACRALTGVAKNMVIALAQQGIDISSVGSYSDENGLVFNDTATNDDAKAIFELLCNHQTTLEGIQNTVYLASTGSDDNLGTENSPYLTLGKALNKVPDGGKIVVDDTVTIPSGFEWEERDKTITITGGTLDFATNAVNNVVIGDNVTFDDITLTFTANDTLYANGYAVKISENVTMTNIITLYGGGPSGTTVEGTDLTVLAGTYKNIYGGSNQGVVGTAGTKLYVGGNVNKDSGAEAHTGSHYHVWAGGNADTINGNTECTFTDNAVAHTLYGGSQGASTVNGVSNVTFSGGSIYCLVGGNNSSSAINGTNVTVTSGTIAQIFGANEGASMTGDVNLQLLGGTITRRVYGGCYNGYGTTSFSTDYYVTGDINLTLGYDVTFNLTDTDNEGDLSVYARSRHNQVSSSENSTIYWTSEAKSKHESTLGAQDEKMKAIMKTSLLFVTDITAADNFVVLEASE